MKRMRLKERDRDPEIAVDKELQDNEEDKVKEEEDKEEGERVAEDELDESLRRALVSTLPLLKSKVRLYTDLKEKQSKDKMDKLENQFAQKDKDLNQLEIEFNAKCDDKEREL